jgi:hypothetical protein
MWQNIVVAMIVLLAVIFTARKFYRSFKQTDRCSCSGGCEGGETSGCCGTPDQLFPLHGDNKRFDK